MPEIDKPGIRSAEGIKQEFRNHLESVEFGSPDYLAFCDYYAFHQQDELRQIDLRNVLTSTTPEHRVGAESSLRITETRMALLSTMIEDRRNNNIDYSNAYSFVEQTMEELFSAILTKVRADNTANNLSNELSISDTGILHSKMVADFREILYRFYERPHGNGEKK